MENATIKDDENEARTMDDINLMARVAQLENLVNHLIEEARLNNRIAIVAVCIMAAGKEIMGALK